MHPGMTWRLASALVTLMALTGLNPSAIAADQTVAEAAAAGDLKKIKKFIRAQADLESTVPNGDTPLIEAVSKGHLPIVQELLAAHVNVNGRGQNARTALLMASQLNYATIVQALLTAGADVNAVSDQGATALLLATTKGNADIAQALLAARADVNQAQNDGSTPLMMAAVKNNLALATLLLGAGANPNAAAKDGSTALMLGAQRNSSVVPALLNANAAVQMKRPDGRTALIDAAQNGHLNMVQALIRRGANVNAAIHADVRPNGGATALMLATVNNHLAVVRELVNAKADVNTRMGVTQVGADTTALSIALEKGFSEVAQFLRQSGATGPTSVVIGSTAGGSAYAKYLDQEARAVFGPGGKMLRGIDGQMRTRNHFISGEVFARDKDKHAVKVSAGISLADFKRVLNAATVSFAEESPGTLRVGDSVFYFEGGKLTDVEM